MSAGMYVLVCVYLYVCVFSYSSLTQPLESNNTRNDESVRRKQGWFVVPRAVAAVEAVLSHSLT